MLDSLWSEVFKTVNIRLYDGIDDEDDDERAMWNWRCGEEGGSHVISTLLYNLTCLSYIFLSLFLDFHKSILREIYYNDVL